MFGFAIQQNSSERVTVSSLLLKITLAVCSKDEAFSETGRGEIWPVKAEAIEPAVADRMSAARTHG